MEKPYLLIAGWNYYPQAGTDDWIACFETYEEAESRVIKINTLSDEDNMTLKVNNESYDWYKIIDLREWTDK